MKRLTTEILDRYSRNGTGFRTTAVAASFTTLTEFEIPTLPEAEWPLLPVAELVVERTVMTALASGHSLCQTVEAARDSLAAVGTSLTHDDLLSRIAASGLQRS